MNTDEGRAGAADLVDFQTRHATQHFSQRGLTGGFDFFAPDHRHVAGDAMQLRGQPRRSDHDFVEHGNLLRLQRQAEQAGDDGGQGFALHGETSFSFPASPQGKIKTRAEKGRAWQRCSLCDRHESRPPRPACCVRPVSGLAPWVKTRVFRLPIPKDSGWVKNREALTVAGAAQVWGRISHLFPVSLREEHLKRAQV
jgi:hypothetical protein